MRYTMLLLSFLFLFLVHIDAKEKSTQSLSLKELIEKIKHSTSNDRRVAMNQLKIKLRTMNSTTRKKIMLDLQKSFITQNSHIHNSNDKPQNGTSSHPSAGGVQQNGGQFHTPTNTTPTTYQPPAQVPMPATPIRTTPSTPIRTTTPSVPVRPNPPRGPYPGGNR